MSVLAEAGPVGGYGQPDDQRRARDAGFSHHMTKAIVDEALKKRLVRIQKPKESLP